MQSNEESRHERIEKFDEFKKHGLLLVKDFFDEHTRKFKSSQDKALVLSQFSQFAKSLLCQLAQTKDKNYILFFDWLPLDFVHILQSLVSQQYPNWQWDHESLFLGGKKQLIVYKNYRPIVQYLQRYRLPNTFEPKKLATRTLIEELTSLRMKRNEMLGEDEDVQDITKRIGECEGKLETAKKDFYGVVGEVLEDFQKKDKRKELNIRSIKTELMGDIKAIVEKTGLKYTIREASKIFWEITIRKPRSSDSRDEEERSSQRSEQKEEEEVKQEKTKPRPVIKPTQKDLTKAQSDDDEQPAQPNKIKQYDVVGIGLGKVEVRFRIPFNNLSPICKFIGYEIDSDGSLIFNCQQNYTPSQGDLYERMTLIGSGFRTFTIMAENEIGIAQQYQTFSCNIPKQNNRKILMVGAALDGLIAGTESNLSEYHEQQLPANISACQISIREAAMAIDTNGTLAMWGNLFQKEFEEEDGVMLYEQSADQAEEKVPVCEISPPYQIEEVKLVTRVSCGQYYYLVCDALGQAWSFGSNWKHCLGLGKVDKNMVTFDPIKIPFFKKNNIFVVDVVASNEHALALDNKGNVYSWGVFEAEMKTYPVKDTFGSTINYTVGKQKFASNEPRLIKNETLSIEKVTKIRAGINFSGIVTQQGQLLMWGSNVFGQLGCGQLVANHTSVKHVLVPIENAFFKKNKLKVLELEVGSFHCLAIAEDKEGKKALYSWGMSLANECGHNICQIIWEPKIIDQFKDHVIELISAGENGSVVKTNKGLYIFGKRTYLAKDLQSLDKIEPTKSRELQFDWWNKVKQVKLAENTAAFLVEY